MKKVIIVAVSIIVGLLVTIISCSKSTIIDIATPRNIDTSVYVPRMKKDTTRVDSSKVDTTRIPISFDVSVDNWGDENINEL